MNNNNFDTSTSICSDDCWKTAKELHNNKISEYNLYPNNFVECENPNVRMTDGYLEHPNLRGRPGYGLADDCLIDNDSMLRNNPDGLTHDRCRIQLNNRIFTSGPSLRCGAGNISEELKESNLICGHIGAAGNYQIPTYNFLRKHKDKFVDLQTCPTNIGFLL